MVLGIEKSTTRLFDATTSRFLTIFWGASKWVIQDTSSLRLETLFEQAREEAGLMQRTSSSPLWKDLQRSLATSSVLKSPRKQRTNCSSRQETGEGNMLSASTGNGVFVSSGVTAMLLWIIIDDFS